MAVRLGRACRHARERAGFRQIDVATESGLRESTISKFESGRGWARETDRIVNAYASLLETTPEQLWREALARDE
jgi:transcriptional regulator with XRE-family HTH domain